MQTKDDLGVLRLILAILWQPLLSHFYSFSTGGGLFDYLGTLVAILATMEGWQPTFPFYSFSTCCGLSLIYLVFSGMLVTSIRCSLTFIPLPSKNGYLYPMQLGGVIR